MGRRRPNLTPPSPKTLAKLRENQVLGVQEIEPFRSTTNATGQGFRESANPQQNFFGRNSLQPLQRVRGLAKQQFRSEFFAAINHYNTRIAGNGKKYCFGRIESECVKSIDRKSVDCTAGSRRARSRYRSPTESGNRASLDDQGDMRFQTRIGSDWAFYLYEPRESHAIYREA